MIGGAGLFEHTEPLNLRVPQNAGNYMTTWELATFKKGKL
jgi:hypothetical protein